jgi:prevent-host-death family protein
MTRVTRKSAETPDSGSDTWTLASAKAHFSEVIERALWLRPQTITRNGRPAAVVVGPDEWERKTRRVGSLTDFFAASPLRDADGLAVERRGDFPRDPAL